MICEAISGNGTVLPPMVILSGVLHQRRWYKSTNIPDDTLIALSDTGYSMMILVSDGLHILNGLPLDARLEHTVYYSLMATVLTVRSNSLTTAIDTISSLFVSTHLLQPLDVVVFQLYKHYNTEAVEQATRTGCSDFNKVEFLHALRSIREQTFKKKKHHPHCIPETGLLPSPPKSFLSNYAKHRHLRVRVHLRPSEVPARVPPTYHSLSGL